MEFLRHKELLLVLDNCEHLLERAAALTRVLQRSCERLVILATSREALTIEGERLVPVPPLRVPGTDAGLAAITQAEAVRLFAERAAAVKPGFQVTAQNAAAVAAVVQRLDGIALAVSALSASIRADVAGAGDLCRRAAEANARRDHPDWRVEETICAARSRIASVTGAFADAAHLAERAAGIARAGGDLADASVELTVAVADHMLTGNAPAAVPLANEALALARQVGAPALIASGLLAVGSAAAGTDPGQARACLRESRELSAALGYQSALDFARAAGITFLIGDLAAHASNGGGHGLGFTRRSR